MSDDKITLLSAIKEAAKARSGVPKLSLGYASGMFALAVLVLREYDKKWPVIDAFAALAAVSLLLAVVAFTVRFVSLKNIETLGAKEMFEGRAPDPEGVPFQKALAEHRSRYRVSGRVALPAFAFGSIMLGVTLLIVIAYHVAT